MKTRFNLTKILALSALVAVFFAPSALIAADDDEADVEEIVVTGSRIKRDSINSAQVITTITAQDIEQSQAQTFYLQYIRFISIDSRKQRYVKHYYQS